MRKFGNPCNIDLSIKSKYVDILNPDGTILIRTNDEVLFNHILIQIVENGYEGFQVRRGSHRVTILKDGTIPIHPTWLFSIRYNQEDKLERIRHKKS